LADGGIELGEFLIAGIKAPLEVSKLYKDE
jgi:hypothetical protein